MRFTDMKKRRSLKYKIKMWFYRLTFQDFKILFITIGKIIITFIGFLFLFILPHIFH